jgi:asparagine synthase (glutamine-hydrolysing)
MCGINGIFAYHYAANPVDRGELLRTRDHMAARGPDGEGMWISEDGCIGLGHRRLSIIDLSEAGAQPMINADGNIAISFNGEIYNYRALRRQLEVQGRTFRSETDTEVLLHLYEQYGDAMLQHLRGMFAFAVWDARRNRLFLARDPYGIKPLYYSDDGWTLRFASQVKALLAGGRVSRAPEPAGWVGYYLFGSVPEPFTTFRDIREVPAGASIIVDRLGPHPAKPFFSVAQAYCEAEQQVDRKGDAREHSDQIRSILLNSVRHHLVADVPVGAFLSAGIDSSALVGLMRDVSQTDIRTITIAFRDFRNTAQDEAPLAEEVARCFGTNHTTRIVTEQEFIEDLPRIWDAMDQPTIDGVNTWFVSKAAKELGLKVAISGLGGDELFGGYPSFTSIPQWVRSLSVPSRLPFLGHLFRIAASTPAGLAILANPKAAGMVELGGSYAGAYLLRRGLFMPWELEKVLDKALVIEGLRRLKPLLHIGETLKPKPISPFARVAALESSLYMRNQLLRDTDWAGMAHSIEIRTPLVDATLLQEVAPIFANAGFAVSKKILAGSTGKPLPNEIVSRPKTGFVTPIEEWISRSRFGAIRSYSDVPILRDSRCPWARRWAYSIGAAA